MRWDDLRIFLFVAREGGLTGAAKALRLDPATVGRRVAALEAALDRKLFAKSPQGYALTEDGTRLLPRAEAMEAETRAGLEELTGRDEGLSGTIRIGAPDGCANYLLPRVCADISRQNPSLDLQIIAQPRVVDLSRREADLAITVSQPTAGRLLVQKISEYHLVLAAARSYLASAPRIDTLADLQRHRSVGYIPDMIFDEELDYLGPLGIDRVALASTSAAVQVQLLRAGGGIGVVHEFALRDVPDLVPILPEQVRLTRNFYLVRHADDRRSERLRAVSQALLTGMKAALAPS
ncbi:MAG: LysR family transcriptional regulator [Pseudomonadota bacterium]